MVSPDSFSRRRVAMEREIEPQHIEEAVGGADALSRLESGRHHAVILDRRINDLDADEVIEIIRSRFPAIDVIAFDSHSHEPVLFDAPETPARDLDTGTSTPGGVIGSSPLMQRVFHLVRRVASRDTAVLLTGETGTGKEVIARAIHELSPRACRPMVTVNCAAIPEALLESELFGHTRGAFTGAIQSRLGRVHAAQGGTLFLDEVGDIPPGLQAKLLRFLESGEVQRLGSADVFRVDVRVIAATNANLESRIAEKQFRDDLYYRLAVFPIELPPLRDRGQDVLLLANHFLNNFCGAQARFDDSAESWIVNQPWPGNVRELRHRVERASVLWGGKGAVGVAELRG